MSYIQARTSLIVKTVLWLAVLGLATLLIISLKTSSSKVSAQAASGGNCRVGIAVDRSGSVANRDPNNVHHVKRQLKSLLQTTDGINNRIDNPNIDLGFWSFGTAASGYRGVPGGISFPPGVSEINGQGEFNVDYPYYVYPVDGANEWWINTTESETGVRANKWATQIQRIPFYIGSAVFLEPSWVAPGQYPSWAAHYPPLTPFGLVTQNIPNIGNPAEHANQPGTVPYFGTYRNNSILSPTSERAYFYSNYAGSTNWEAGLGSNASGLAHGSGNGKLGNGWGGVLRADEADVVVLFTDAIEQPLSSTWFADPGNLEPNWPNNLPYPAGYPSGSHYTVGQAWAHRAADELRDEGKKVAVVSYDPRAKESTNYRQIADSEDDIFVLSGGLSDLGARLKEVAEQKCSEFADKPFLQVFNSGVLAGSRFADGSGVCNAAAPAGIHTYSKSIDISAGGVSAKYWVGSSSHFAASATGAIQGFFSANRRNNFANPPTPTDGLSFGNFGSSSVGGAPPGDSGMSRCIPDYYEIYSSQSGSQAISGGTFSYANMPSGQDIVRHKDDGDLFINGNTTFASNGVWGSLNGLSSLTVAVKGDIYIGSNVTELNGTFIALPKEDGSGGRIFTCATGNGSIPSASQMLNTCSNKLTIRGSFIADQVKFFRTNGNVENATIVQPGASNIAEEFVFPYDIYLTDPGSSSGRSSSPYDNIISLPPIL